MSKKPAAAPADHQSVTTPEEAPTNADPHAEISTLESILRQPRPETSYSDDAACQQLVQRVQQIPAGVSRSAQDKSPSDGIPHERLGQYELLSKIGEGGMGAVYQARHTKLNKRVALKVLPGDRLEDNQAVTRFEREMRAVGQLNHSNIVAAHDAGEIDGSHFLVMELVDGIDLSTLVRRCGPLPVADACAIICRAAEGLQYAHQFGMVHRDIKPGNLMLTFDGGIKILDMGLALLDEMKGPGQQGELTTTGQMMGTLDYMAPEQGMDSHQVDIRADVYALGATLFKLLTGEAPFHGPQYDTPVSKMMALAVTTPRRLSEVRDDIPPELAEIVARLLAKNPDERPATPQEVVELLAPLADGAQLREVASIAKDRLESAIEAPSGETFAHLRSSFTGTSPTLPAVAQPVASSAAPPDSKRRWWIAGAVALAGCLLLAVVLTLRTDKGTIIVEVPDGQESNVEISVRSGGEEVEVLDADHGWAIQVKEGKYELNVKKGGDRFAIEDHELTVTRNGKVRAKVTYQPVQVASADRRTETGLPDNRRANIPADAKKFAGHWYKEYKSPLNWQDAIEFCEQQGGYLARIESPEEFEFVRTLARDGVSYRIDGSNKANRDRWVFSDGQAVTHFAWGKNEPQNINGREFWLELSKDMDHRYNNIDNEGKRSFICEWSPNYALQFDGRDDYVVTPIKLDGSPYTIEVFATVDRYQPGMTILGSMHERVGMSLEWVDGRWRHTQRLGPKLEHALAHDEVPEKQRTHYAIVWDGKQSRIFINGAAQPDVVTSTESAGGRYPLVIGADFIEGDKRAENFFAGQIDEVRVSKIARYRDSFTPVQRFTADADTLALYHCDEGQGEVLIDSSTNKMHGKIMGATWVEAGPVSASPFPNDGTVDQQQAWLLAELNRLNPQLKAEVSFRDENGKITFVGLSHQHDRLQDISPLANVPLTGLNLSRTEALTDFSALAGLPLRTVTMHGSQVSDLSPLKDAPLETLEAESARNLSDLTVLQKAKLTKLHIDGTAVSDLTQLLRHPLEILRVDIRSNADRDTLRKIPTLKTINGKPAAEVLAGDYAVYTPATPFPEAGNIEEKKAWVIAELKRLNPKYDGQLNVTESGGWIVQVKMDKAAVTNLQPLSALRRLEGLWCQWTEVRDLSPLAELPLKELYINDTPVADLSALQDARLQRLEIRSTLVNDLSPLSGMPLHTIVANSSRIVDLSPLKDSPLKDIVIHDTQVTDITPLAGKSLTLLGVRATRVTDLAPLAGITSLRVLDITETAIKGLEPVGESPIAELACRGAPIVDFTPVAHRPLSRLEASADLVRRDAAILRQVSTLKTINGEPAGEVLAASLAPYRPAKPFPAQGNIEEKQAWLTAELHRANPRFDGKAIFQPSANEGEITALGINTRGDLNRTFDSLAPLSQLPHLMSLSCEKTAVADLSPLHGLQLERLNIGSGTLVADLTPLTGMPLTYLDIDHTKVTDLAPLEGMPLKYLDCEDLRVTDLKPLAGMPLEKLNLAFNNTLVDITPLRGAPLTFLSIKNTKVVDLSPLRDSPLETLICDFVADRDRDILRQIKSLKTINGKPAVEVLVASTPEAGFPARGSSQEESTHEPK